MHIDIHTHTHAYTHTQIYTYTDRLLMHAGDLRKQKCISDMGAKRRERDMYRDSEKPTCEVA